MQNWLAIVIVIAVVLMALIVAKKDKNKFYTEYARENPTRSYTPYTGTIPVGPWGVQPWGEAVRGRVETAGLYDPEVCKFME